MFKSVDEGTKCEYCALPFYEDYLQRDASQCIRLSVPHTYLIRSSHPRSAVRLHRVSVGSTTNKET